ncbi:MAG TPA: HEAT repeat domain-containing protein [Bacteroidota bacterium]|jgi:hypothetical protein|nr:HEAT repeat domain-containing protein [Bacteroidota bacterium]
MNHEQVKEQIELLYYDELDRREREEAEAHMGSCAECRSLFDELKKLHGVLAQFQPMEADEKLLADARVGLQSALRDERLNRSWWERVSGLTVGFLLPQYRIAFGGVATITIGVVIGYVAFKSPSVPVQPPAQMQGQQAVMQERPALPEGGQISNVRFIDSDTRDGDVEFSFDAVMPMHLKGKVNDPQIQQVLSYALLNEQNPGVRLRSVSAMGSEQGVQNDEEVKHVLITALKSDDNAGVRKEALQALQKFAFDDEIKKTFMDVLVHDSNSAIRIAAINALDSTRTKGITPDQDLMDIFKDKMTSDKNPYVRIRAKAALQEANQ